MRKVQNAFFFFAGGNTKKFIYEKKWDVNGNLIQTFN